MKAKLFIPSLLLSLSLSLGLNAQEQDRPAFLAMEHSKTLALSDMVFSFRYGLQSTLLRGQPNDPVFGEFNFRAGLLSREHAGYPYGIDAFGALFVTQTDFQAGTLPMGTIGVRGQFLQGGGFVPTISLQTSATLANKYRSVWSFTLSSSWDWKLDVLYGSFLVGGQLGIATVPSPNQTTKGPFFYRDLMLAASIGIWRIELVVEYGGDFEIGYLGSGARCHLWQGLYLSGGIRLNLVSVGSAGLSDLAGFGGVSWYF